VEPGGTAVESIGAESIGAFGRAKSAGVKPVGAELPLALSN